MPSPPLLTSLEELRLTFAGNISVLEVPGRPPEVAISRLPKVKLHEPVSKAPRGGSLYSNTL